MKKMYALLLVFLPAAAVYANCVDGQGRMTYEDGGKSVGEWKNGNRRGQGLLTYPDNSIGVGQCKDGLFVESGE